MPAADDVAARTARLGPADAGETFTLQLAAWVKEAHENGTLAIPPLQERLGDVEAALRDPALAWWGHRDRSGRLLAMVRTSVRDDGRTGFIGRLGVVPDRIGTGLGSAMLRFGESRLPGGVERISLITGARSVSNHCFYVHHGYAFVDDPDVPEGAVLLTKVLPAR